MLALKVWRQDQLLWALQGWRQDQILWALKVWRQDQILWPLQGRRLEIQWAPANYQGLFIWKSSMTKN